MMILYLAFFLHGICALNNGYLLAFYDVCTYRTSGQMSRRIAAAAGAAAAVAPRDAVGERQRPRSSNATTTKNNRRLRSRNPVIDQWLRFEEQGDDTYADLEDFLV